jgi:hypothetical protein
MGDTVFINSLPTPPLSDVDAGDVGHCPMDIKPGISAAKLSASEFAL